MSKISAASLPFGGGGAQGGVVGEAGKLSRESVGAVEVGAGVGVSEAFHRRAKGWRPRRSKPKRVSRAWATDERLVSTR